MTERSDRVSLVVEDCVEYWRRTGVPRSAVAGMREELEQHLRDAVTEGKSVESVVGPDVLAFTEEWAREYRGPSVPGHPVDGRGPGFLALGTGILALLTMLAFTASVSGGGVEVCCPRRVFEAERTLEPGALLWIVMTLAVFALTLAGAVALFRGRLGLGGWVLLAAALPAILTPAHVFVAGLLFAAGAWALVRAKRAETSIATR
jgi:hypothetical protein